MGWAVLTGRILGRKMVDGGGKMVDDVFVRRIWVGVFAI
jgi:hypothetical protein